MKGVITRKKVVTQKCVITQNKMHSNAKKAKYRTEKRSYAKQLA
jgi:hypothetical protein